MTPTWAGIVATGVLGLVCCIAGLTVAYVHMGRALKAREADRDERHVAEVQVWKAMPDRPLDGSAVDTQILKPVLVVRRELHDAVVGTSEGRHHHRDQVEAAWHWHRPLHAAIGRRDPRIDALLTKTQKLFVQTLERAGETPPQSFGPRERIAHRRIEWTDETGWQQPELEVGI